MSGRKARALIALETGLDPKDVQLEGSKKHFKGNKKAKAKARTRTGGDPDSQRAAGSRNHIVAVQCTVA